MQLQGRLRRRGQTKMAIDHSLLANRTSDVYLQWMAVQKGVLHAKFTDPLLGESDDDDDNEDEREHEDEEDDEGHAERSRSPTAEPLRPPTPTMSMSTLADAALGMLSMKDTESASGHGDPMDIGEPNPLLAPPIDFSVPTLAGPSTQSQPLQSSPLTTLPPSTPRLSQPALPAVADDFPIADLAESPPRCNPPRRVYGAGSKRPPNSPPQDSSRPRPRPRLISSSETTLPPRVEDTRPAPPPLDINARPRKEAKGKRNM